MGFAARHWILFRVCVVSALLFARRGEAAGPVRYSVLEESGAGTAVGNVARDLGVDVKDLYGRKFRTTYESEVQYFDVNLKTGALLTKEILDREALCGSAFPCVINLEALMDSPMAFHRLEVEIVDINDNAPLFPASETRFTVGELTLPGAHFPLEGAFDPDVGTNALCTYQMTKNDFFILESAVSEYKSQSLELVLTKALDREQRGAHHLTITAADGGTPKRTGTTEIIIQVQDANDNPPAFEKSVFRVTVPENTPAGSVLLKLNATDPDEGANGEIEYSFSKRALSGIEHLFSIDPEDGEIRVCGLLDFEASGLHELNVRAQDKGPLPMTAHCKVLVEIIDLNDNAPEIRVNSISSPIREDAQAGLVVAMFTVSDKDAGVNGEVGCHISPNLPFVIESRYQNYYSLVVKDLLDREVVSEYNITLFATDGGSPSQSSMKTIVLVVSDVNDNPPAFSELQNVISVPENSAPGSQLLQVTALDPDMGDNARVRYALLENSIDDVPVLSLFSVHTETGVIFALQPFDFEKLQMLQFQVEARDYGSPTLSCKTNVTVFVQDQNDNPPTIFHISSGNSASEDTVLVPRSASTGYMVTKVRAIDADSGHNAWLSYEFKESTITTSFRIGQKSGEISLRHPLGESYPERLELIILVKDHGTPLQSATTTLTVSMVELNPEVKSDKRHVEMEENNLTNLNSYLIISIAFISSLFIFCIILLTALQYFNAKSNRGIPEKTDFCPDGGGNWLHSQSQQHNVYLTARSSECDHETQNASVYDQGSAQVEVTGRVAVDLMQRYSIAEGSAMQTPIEVSQTFSY